MEINRGEMQDLLSRFASQNPEYRAALLRNPKGVVEAQFQMELPENMEVGVLEETPEKVYVVLPNTPEEGAELSDKDLADVIGGNIVFGNANCSDSIASTVVEINASLF